MSIRKDHAKLLLEAANHLEVVDEQSALPEICLSNALNKVEQVWTESAVYIDPIARKQLRFAIVSLRGIKQMCAREEDLTSKEVASIKQFSTKFKEFGGVILHRPEKAKSEPVSDFSPLGLRMHSLADLAGMPVTVLPSNMHTQKSTAAKKEDYRSLEKIASDETTKRTSADAERLIETQKRLAAADAFRSKLKAKVGSAGFVEDFMPILVFPKKFDRSALSRADISYTEIPGGYLLKNHAVMGESSLSDTPTVIFNNQLVVGIDSGKSDNPEFVKKVVERINQRRGHHTNPLDTHAKSVKFLRSPGNHLSWMWLVPDHVISSGAVSVLTASFPWMTKETPQKIEQRIAENRKELEDLQSKQAFLVKNGKRLDDKALTRISELKEVIDRHSQKPKPETLEEKTHRLARQKAQVEQLVTKNFGAKIATLADIKSELKDLGIPNKDKPEQVKTFKKLKAEVTKLTTEIEDGRRKISMDIAQNRYTPEQLVTLGIK